MFAFGNQITLADKLGKAPGSYSLSKLMSLLYKNTKIQRKTVGQLWLKQGCSKVQSPVVNKYALQGIGKIVCAVVEL